MQLSFKAFNEDKTKYYELTLVHDSRRNFVTVSNERGEGGTVREELFYYLLDEFFDKEFQI